MMPRDDASVSRMLETYRDLIRRFAIGEISADEFEADYLARFKDDPTQVIGEEFDILDGLFADVDDYVSDSTLRGRTGGISGEELRGRARDAYARLSGDPGGIGRLDVLFYVDLIDRFIGRDISAPDFEKSFLQAMKSERRILGDPVYPILQELFEDADAYVEQAGLRTEPEDLDDEQLHASAVRARHALRGLGYE